jgi:hypothetical protein
LSIQGYSSFFSTDKDAYSHCSDLFRGFVLYKFGGGYTDLDFIWLRPIDQVFSSTVWILSTPSKQENFDEQDFIAVGSIRLFLEGGMHQKTMRNQNIFANHPGEASAES